MTAAAAREEGKRGEGRSTLCMSAVRSVGRSVGRKLSVELPQTPSSSRTIPLEGCLHHSFHGVITRGVGQQGGLLASDKQLDLACKSSRASAGRRSIMPAVKGGRERTSLKARPAPVSARAPAASRCPWGIFLVARNCGRKGSLRGRHDWERQIVIWGQIRSSLVLLTNVKVFRLENIHKV